MRARDGGQQSRPLESHQVHRQPGLLRPAGQRQHRARHRQHRRRQPRRSRPARCRRDRLPDRRHQPQGHSLGRRPAHHAGSRIRLGQDQGHDITALLNGAPTAARASTATPSAATPAAPTTARTTSGATTSRPPVTVNACAMLGKPTDVAAVKVGQTSSSTRSRSTTSAPTI